MHRAGSSGRAGASAHPGWAPAAGTRCGRRGRRSRRQAAAQGTATRWGGPGSLSPSHPSPPPEGPGFPPPPPPPPPPSSGRRRTAMPKQAPAGLIRPCLACRPAYASSSSFSAHHQSSPVKRCSDMCCARCKHVTVEERAAGGVHPAVAISNAKTWCSTSQRPNCNSGLFLVGDDVMM